MMSCPTCGKPVDPLRAPAVKVTEGKVVPFCSKECAAAADTQPVRMQPTKVVRMPSHAEGRKAAEALRTPASGVPAARAGADSGPVIEILHEPASGVVTSAADARSGRASTNARAETDGAIQIADTGHIDDFVSYDAPRRGRLLLVVLLVLLVIGGGAATAYYLGYFDQYLHRDSVAAAPKDSPKAEPVIVDAAPPITPDLALDRARVVLQTQMKSDSPRVQRVAASALARTGDKPALDLLAAALAKETSDIAKLEIGYALARGGDRRGTDVLMAGVGAGKRDPRLEAGRRLALLGDKRAINVLESFLKYEQFRLGIAEQLAYFAEPRALKVLDEVRADDKAAPDEKARATIALGHAGRAEVAPALRELLTDDRNNAFAAVALAGLHDEAARPVLIKQLTIPSLRVQAARALRRLSPSADVRELLPPLLAALDSNKDTEQVQIAEAILLLAGPPAWSEKE
jgi:HEAT repeat protein/YHS domain-containing protein